MLALTGNQQEENAKIHRMVVGSPERDKRLFPLIPARHQPVDFSFLKVIMLTQSRLKELLTYDPAKGVFTWAVNLRNGTRVGNVAGWHHPDGYLKISIDGANYFCHRLAFLFVDGIMPPMVDHKNGKRADNRFDNLRAADAFINSQNIRCARPNNRSGFLGVSKKATGFQAAIKHNKKVNYLGTFETAGEAHSAYLLAKRAIHLGCTI